METAGIILAAGRGSRMGNLTEDKPKCLIELAGKPLLEWQLEALRKAGIQNVLVIRGYKGYLLTGNFETAENPDWENTNMLSTLLAGNEFAKKFFAAGGERIIVSYSDIVYSHDHLRKLLQATLPIAITYDTLWEALWRLRFDDLLSDAETFLQKNGILAEIGGRTRDIRNIQGQYMGLISFNKSGWKTLVEICRKLGEKTAKTDMTAFLRHLLKNGEKIEAVPVAARWCEADNENDIARYEKAICKGEWAHDWRENSKEII